MCDSTFPSRELFLRHVNYLHRPATMFCDLCPQSFRQKRFLKIHLRNFHMKLRPFACKVCEFKTFFKKSFRRHLYCHGSKTECKICHKLVSNLEQHLKSRHVKKFACNICEYRTADKRTFENHKQAHKGKVTCPVCHKRVLSLFEHMKTHDPKKTCPICQKMVKKLNFNVHIKTHKVLKCTDCEKTFVIREFLRR